MNTKKTEPLPVKDEAAEMRAALEKIHDLARGQGKHTDYIERRMAAIEKLTEPFAKA